MALRPTGGMLSCPVQKICGHMWTVSRFVHTVLGQDTPATQVGHCRMSMLRYATLRIVAGLRRACRGDTANPTLRTAMAARRVGLTLLTPPGGLCADALGCKRRACRWAMQLLSNTIDIGIYIRMHKQANPLNAHTSIDTVCILAADTPTRQPEFVTAIVVAALAVPRVSLSLSLPLLLLRLYLPALAHSPSGGVHNVSLW